MRFLTFLKQCLFAHHTTGALAPSSRALARCMVRAADVANAKTVVEFGPGTGVFTAVILAGLAPDAKFLGLEINADLAAVLRERFPDATIVHDSAANARQHLQAIGEDGCDCIICGLPWTIFDDGLQDQLLDAVEDTLRPGGRFVTFAYLTSPLMRGGKRFREKLEQRFGEVTTTRMVWWNFPPAFAYRAVKM